MISAKPRGLPAILDSPGRFGRPASGRQRSRLPGGERMTIGIGVICHNAQCIIMAADRRGSYANPRLGSHEDIGKQFDLPFGCCANIAGTVSACNGVVSALYAHMEAIEEPVWADKVRTAVREAQMAELSEMYDMALLNNLGMRLSEWRAAWPADSRIRRAGGAVFRITPFEVELIVGGFVGGGPLLITAMGKEPTEVSQNLAVVGSGWEEALDVLNKRKQSPFTSVMSSVVHICEAMEAAKAQPTVGEQANYVVLTPKQVRRLPVPYARSLAARWAGRDTMDLDLDSGPESRREFDELLSALYVQGVTVEEYAQGKRAPSPKPPIAQT